ncbi:MAG: tRNA (adenosine(37)-N6)-dimethylallyltransferase MiaA [Bacilli bacterium]|nr:tRNA (adenosine(37)-N6)-dimethylallyltransferase MiaA [Bacilli bacterium]
MIIVLTGATGSGKSRLAIALANSIGGEIVNGDAFQVYKGIEIATAAPSEEEKKLAKHHLYSFLDVNDGYDISRYQKDLRAKIEEVLSRGSVPIICGGSGLYLRAALYDYDLSVDTKHVDMSKYQDMDNESLHKVLEELDAKEAEKIHMNNRIRVMRAIEICLASETSKSEMIEKQSHKPIYDDCYFFVLKRDRNELYPLVEKRVDEMVKNGLVEETLSMIEKYGREAPAFKAIGIKEFFPYLDGMVKLEDAINTIKTNTRHYIKRQETFFRHQFEVVEISNVDDILKVIKENDDVTA